ncbi:MAG: hypothetical protein WAU01_01420 [Saprospiraceae bacterium]
MKYLFVCILLGMVMGCQRNATVSPQKASEIFNAKVIHLKTYGVVIRIPTQSKKVAFLKSQVGKTGLSAKEKQKINDQITSILSEDQRVLSSILDAFKRNFKSVHFHYIPDTSYKVWLDDENIPILDSVGTPVTTGVPSQNYLLISRRADVNQWICTDVYGNKLPEPFPYRKNIFFPAFKRLFDPDKYLEDQILWFNDRLTDVINNFNFSAQ